MSEDLTRNPNVSLEDKIDRLIAVVQSMDSRVESMDSRLEGVELRLGALETKVDERLKDTRPMWEAVQAQIAHLESTLRAEMEKGFRMVDRQMEHVASEFFKVHGYQRDLEDRVKKIEKHLDR